MYQHGHMQITIHKAFLKKNGIKNEGNENVNVDDQVKEKGIKKSINKDRHTSKNDITKTIKIHKERKTTTTITENERMCGTKTQRKTTTNTQTRITILIEDRQKQRKTETTRKTDNTT